MSRTKDDFYDQLAMKWIDDIAFSNRKYPEGSNQAEMLSMAELNKWDAAYNNETIKPEADAINPSHYKNVAAGKQYMELMVDMLEGKNGVEAHLLGQVYKYLMRCGKKDNEIQELEKADWYLDALIKYKQTGKVL